MRIKIIITLFVALALSCNEKSVQPPTKMVEIEPMKFLPFQQINVDGLSDFKEVSDNWKIVGNVYVDRSKDKAISTMEGSGVLINQPEEGSRENLFTNFGHGDLELEVDVMMPVKSNSGIYFQGRYEVQLFDSWGTEEPKHSDMAGIYQRWDDNRREGQEGFEGSAPKTNAAKAPGLWQRFKIIFHAPRFDDAGKKIKNAWFEEVWLNGVLVQENVEVSGPTRAAAFEDEKPLGSLMIQGDHGPVALKNIRYKMYGNKKISLLDITMNEYENKEVLLPSLDSIVPIRTIKTDSISANMVGGDRSQRILKYAGTMNIPDSGEYLFDLKVNGAGGILLIDKDTVVNLDGDYNLDSLGLGQIGLQKGTIPFTLIYNKHRPWTKGFSLEVEGPGMQKHSLQAANSMDLSRGKPAENIMVEVREEPVAQRSFLMHDGLKRTHCISVGTPQKINYAYDLEYGSL
ncbi:MAG: 3-keto-disaccharide hydrolase, partial [Aurantibacter sp.]